MNLTLLVGKIHTVYRPDKQSFCADKTIVISLRIDAPSSLFMKLMARNQSIAFLSAGSPPAGNHILSAGQKCIPDTVKCLGNKLFS